MSTTSLSGDAVLQEVYDSSTHSLKTTVTANISGAQEVLISDLDDSIKIGNGNGRYVAVNSDGSINVGATFSGNVGTIESGTVDVSFGDVSSVGANILTTLTTYVAAGPTRIKFAEVSGTNIATYTISINGSTINKKQTFYGYLDNDFQFSKGLPIDSGDIVRVQVIHQQPSVGEFSAFLLLLKDY